MATTYLLLADLRAYAGVPATGEDAYIQALLDAAAEQVDSYCNTRFASTAITLDLHDGDGSRFLKLRHRPVIAVSDVQLAGASIDSALYVVDLAQGYIVLPVLTSDYPRDPRVWRGDTPQGWPRGNQNIGVSYTYGYATVPADVIVATGMIAAALYQDNARRGVQSESAGPYSTTYIQGAEGLPLSTRRLLHRYIEHELGG